MLPNILPLRFATLTVVPAQPLQRTGIRSPLACANPLRICITPIGRYWVCGDSASPAVQDRRRRPHSSSCAAFVSAGHSQSGAAPRIGSKTTAGTAPLRQQRRTPRCLSPRTRRPPQNLLTPAWPRPGSGPCSARWTACSRGPWAASPTPPEPPTTSAAGGGLTPRRFGVNRGTRSRRNGEGDGCRGGSWGRWCGLGRREHTSGVGRESTIRCHGAGGCSCGSSAGGPCGRARFSCSWRHLTR